MMKKSVFSAVFLASLCAIWLGSDLIMTRTEPATHIKYFPKNDYDITRIKHPEKDWDKVFFGSSVVVSSFIEEESESGFINFGIDYGTVSDIYNALDKGIVSIDSELVVGLNHIALLDTLPTNATYPWHKKWYQHYIYFKRDNIYPAVSSAFDNLLSLKSPTDGLATYENSQKFLYYGTLTDEEIQVAFNNMVDRFGGSTLNDCKDNFSDLKKLIKLCKERNIRLRFVWMPWNPDLPLYDFCDKMMAETNKILEENNIEVFDMTRQLERQEFYDIGHISYPDGAKTFTHELDEFLMK